MKTDKKLEQELGKLFRSERMKVGLSQGKVCQALGYSTPQYLSNFERGLCSMPLDKLKKMIDMYDMDGESVVRLMMELQVKFLRSQLLKGPKSRKRQTSLGV
jgi:transcriptional regulator with XRE-family HTH domain